MEEIFNLPVSRNTKSVYTNARIIDPESKLDIYGNLLIENGIITEITSGNSYGNHSSISRIVNCNGLSIIPGLVDIHVHLRDPGEEYKEDLQSGSKSAVAGGVTSVVCQPNTIPNIDNLLTVRYIKDKAKKCAFCEIYFYASATTKGGSKISDMPALFKEGALGFTDDGLPVSNSSLMLDAFVTASKLGVPVAQHAEDLELTKEGCINYGAVSAEMGLKGIMDISESIMVERDIQLMKYAKSAHYHLLHVSTKRSLDSVIEAKKSGLKVTCEVTPHHFLLNEESVKKKRAYAKMKPPLRSEEDRLAMLNALKNGLIDCIATDHAPHNPEIKNNEDIPGAAFGVVGLETLLPLSLELWHNHKMDLHEVLALITYKPSDVVGIDRGRIAKGKIANLAVVDLEADITIDSSKFHGKSNNSPFHGRNSRGSVIETVIQGSTVFRKPNRISESTAA